MYILFFFLYIFLMSFYFTLIANIIIQNLIHNQDCIKMNEHYNFIEMCLLWYLHYPISYSLENWLTINF